MSWRRPFFLVLIVAVALATAGCDQVSALLGWARSIKTFDACLKDGKAAGSASLDTVKKSCAAQYQGTIRAADVVEGTGGYDHCLPENVVEMKPLVTGKSYNIDDTYFIKNAEVPRECDQFSGTLKNASVKLVVTSVTVVFKHQSAKEEKQVVDGLWLEPGKSKQFAVNVDTKITKARYDENMSGKFNWHVEGAKGFILDY